MRLFKLILLLFMTCFLSCKKKEEFSIEQIKIPPYYSLFNERRFWESQGAKYWGGNANYDTIKAGVYKDSSSTNFINVNELNNTIISLTEAERIKYLNDFKGFNLYSANKKLEIYRSESIDTFPNKKILYSFNTAFILKIDSVYIEVGFQTFDNKMTKIKDYNRIVNEIGLKCKTATYKSSHLIRRKENEIIAN